MLEELRIRGLGVIDEAILPLGPGLTVVTGETGAGKTMVVTGLLLLFGGRADAARVRTGAEQAAVEGRLTVRDDTVAARVAERAGVSRATAARALGGYGSTSPAARDRVLAAAAALGYRPNLPARYTRNGTTNTVGVVVADIAKSMSISESCLRNWMAQADTDDGVGESERLTSKERAELAELRKDKRRLEVENEILKRAAAYFARENVLPK